MAEDGSKTKDECCRDASKEIRTVLKDAHSAGVDCVVDDNKRICFKKMAARIQNYFIKLVKDSKANSCDNDKYRDLIKKAVEYGQLEHSARNASVSMFLKKKIVETLSAKKVGQRNWGP